MSLPIVDVEQSSSPTIDVEKAFRVFVELFGGDVSFADLNQAAGAQYLFPDHKIVGSLKILKTDPIKNREFQKSFLKKQQEWIQKGYITLAELRGITKINQL